MKTATERFWANVDIWDPDHCWIWQGIPAWRYGTLRVDGRITKAHRFSYELLIGPIPAGLEVDHLCEVPACVNPKHLQAVTHQQNLRRARGPAARARETGCCVNGHPWTEANTYHAAGRGRTCRACRAEQAARHRQRQAEQASKRTSDA